MRLPLLLALCALALTLPGCPRPRPALGVAAIGTVTASVQVGARTVTIALGHGSTFTGSRVGELPDGAPTVELDWHGPDGNATVSVSAEGRWIVARSAGQAWVSSDPDEDLVGLMAGELRFAPRRVVAAAAGKELHRHTWRGSLPSSAGLGSELELRLYVYGEGKTALVWRIDGAPLPVRGQTWAASGTDVHRMNLELTGGATIDVPSFDGVAGIATGTVTSGGQRGELILRRELRAD